VGIERIIQKLDKLEKEEGKLPELLQFYRRLLQIQAGVWGKIKAPDPGLTGNTATEQPGQEKPLLQVEEFTLNWPLFHETLQNVINLFSEYSGLFGLTPETFKESSPEKLVTRDSVQAWYTGEELPSAGAISGDILKVLIHAAVKPFLVNHARALIGLVEQTAWRKNYCPVCGGSPDFAYLETERGARWLLCSRCDTEWLYQRLECPYCRSHDQKNLSYFSDEGEVYRLYVCDKCKHYLKTIDLRKAKSGVELTLERLLTYEMDVQAQEDGYLPIG